MFLFELFEIKEDSNLEEIKSAYERKISDIKTSRYSKDEIDIKILILDKTYMILSDKFLSKKYQLIDSKIKELSKEQKIKIKRRYNSALKRDIRQSQESKGIIHYNRDLELVNFLYELSINQNIHSKLIEEYFLFLDESYEEITIEKYKVISNNPVKWDNEPLGIEKEDNLENDNPSGLEEDDYTNTNNSIETKQKTLGKNEFEITDNPSKVALYIFISIIILMIIGSIFSNYQINEKESNLSDSRIDRALNNPLLYWEYQFASPTHDNTYMTIKKDNNKYCFLVGVTFDKNIDSYYYLEDKYDDGEISIRTSDFRINQLYSFHGSRIYACQSMFDDFEIVTEYSYNVSEGESIYLLFEVDLSELTEPIIFKYKNIPITELIIDELD